MPSWQPGAPARRYDMTQTQTMHSTIRVLDLVSGDVSEHPAAARVCALAPTDPEDNGLSPEAVAGRDTWTLAECEPGDRVLVEDLATDPDAPAWWPSVVED
jgi:hypothetical protein